MPSSVVSTMNYDPAKEILKVKFVSGLVYEYKNVPEKVFKAMRTASSKGTFLNKHIKGRYEFEKVEQK